MANPSTYTPELADEICQRLSKGEPLAVICRDEHMPAVRTVSGWKKLHADFEERFLQARDDGFDAIAAQCMEIADDEQHDWTMTKKGVITNDVAVGRAKLQVETRLKLLAKWDPRRYGELQKVQHSGEVTVIGLAGRMRNRGPLA